MGFLTEIFGIGASVASGGLFGLLGSIVGAGSKYLQEKQRQAWQREKWAYETELLKLQMEARALETERELAIVSQQGAWDGLARSAEAEMSVRGVHTWVNDLRALFRPGLTLCLWMIASILFFAVVSGRLVDWISAAELTGLVRYMVYTVFFSASTATVWWFGDRALMPPGFKNR